MAAFIKFSGVRFNPKQLGDMLKKVSEIIIDISKSEVPSLRVWISDADDIALQKKDYIHFFRNNESILNSANSTYHVESCHVEFSLYWGLNSIASPYLIFDAETLACLAAIPATLGVRVFPCVEDEDNGA